MSDQGSGDEIEHSEYEFAIPPKGPFKNFNKRHEDIANILKIPIEDQYLRFIFKVAIALCDPFTQPEENDDNTLGVQLISDLLISFSYDKYEKDEFMELDSIKFDLSTKFFQLVQLIHLGLNANDELRLRFIDNSDKNWAKSLSKWTPNPSLASNEHSLKLVYSVACVLLMAIYKLMPNQDDIFNLSQNPYLHTFLKLWKCHTNIILLGLEIDRRIEFNNLKHDSELETPPIILQVLKGSSSIRYVLAWALNKNPSSSINGESYEKKLDNDYLKDFIDLSDEPIFNFIQPLARVIDNGGAISLDMRLIMIALLVLYSGTSFTSEQYSQIDEPSKNKEHASRKLNRCKSVSEIGDILIDLEYADRFDEDIKYMLEEYECLEESEDDDDEDEEEEVEEDGSDENDEESESIRKNYTKEEIKRRSKQVENEDENIDIQFDEFGRDWRDIARGENGEFKTETLKLFKTVDSSREYILHEWSDLELRFEYLGRRSIESNASQEQSMGQRIINTISKAIYDEKHNIKSQITPEKIYKYWTSPATDNQIEIVQDQNKTIIPIFRITNFELFLLSNSQLARACMDEMLMCNGHRRIIIWFLTHDINLSNTLVDYVFQLSAGLRGQFETTKPYIFTRKGDKLILSEVEQSMLLHEFFTNSAFYLTANEGLEIDGGYEVVLAESIAKKLITILCLMINQLIRLDIIKLDKNFSKKDDIHDYSNELSVLLIGWIGKVPEARQLYFKVKSANNEQVERIVEEEPVEITSRQEVELFVKYDKMTPNEVNKDLASNPVHCKIIANYASKIEQDLISVYNKDPNKNTNNLQQIEEDFKNFIKYFNALCKIEALCEQLFEKSEAVLSSGDITQFGKISEPELIEESKNKIENEDDAEFSSDFLNGQGKFQDKSKSKQSTKKKSKSKKKNKSKRRG
ncbi:hypothetical protein KGF54_004760 [Candida jiufengensis]|uniref:uncharacterized protein n=1 Tax=Candida jiufengensis TaxID=497108 RepID=UPI0022258D2C|nr:uncharacterized protein KGF54_004760 [Candida jiufengensis]KAI5951685.1 hypothetical protein KGF54_004760 [Candida jiufengensis]